MSMQPKHKQIFKKARQRVQKSISTILRRSGYFSMNLFKNIRFLVEFDFIVFWSIFLGFSGSWKHHYPWFDFLIGNSCKTFVENSRRVNRWLLDSFPISCWLKWTLVFWFYFLDWTLRTCRFFLFNGNISDSLLQKGVLFQK